MLRVRVPCLDRTGHVAQHHIPQLFFVGLGLRLRLGLRVGVKVKVKVKG